MPTTTTTNKPFLTINQTPIYFHQDWKVGIGGGLWSTGLAMSLYLANHTESVCRNLKAMMKQKKLSLLELGSGNGLLSVCFSSTGLFDNIVITDLADHLPLIQRTLDMNPHLATTKFAAMEHEWGVIDDSSTTFDVIVGSDVAYRDELHDPLIVSLLHFSNHNTIVLLGATMHDTKPIFFQKLKDAGFLYERLADQLLDSKFRGYSFALYAIQRAAIK